MYVDEYSMAAIDIVVGFDKPNSYMGFNQALDTETIVIHIFIVFLVTKQPYLAWKSEKKMRTDTLYSEIEKPNFR